MTETSTGTKHFFSLNIIIYSFTYNTSHSFRPSVAYGTGVDTTTSGWRTVNYFIPGVPKFQNQGVNSVCVAQEWFGFGWSAFFFVQCLKFWNL